MVNQIWSICKASVVPMNGCILLIEGARTSLRPIPVQAQTYEIIIISSEEMGVEIFLQKI